MKKLIYISTLSIVLFACSSENKDNIDSVIGSKDLNAIKAKRELIHKEMEVYVAQLAKLDAAIGDLDPNKKNLLVKTMTTKDTLFKHFIEIQGNVNTKENIIIYPEYSGVITQVMVKAGQRVSKGQVLAKIDDAGMSSQLAQAQTQLALAQTTFDRQKKFNFDKQKLIWKANKKWFLK
jgi:membrane fusion protein, multidrug efflux system